MCPEKSYSQAPVYNGEGEGEINTALVLTSGVLVALLVSVLLLIIISALLFFTPFPEKYMPAAVFLASLAGILLGSCKTGKTLGVKGWLNGGLVGVLYVLVVVILGGFYLEGFLPGLSLFSKLFLGFVLGAVGGMWGVNS